MYIKNFVRYIENKDVSKIPMNSLTAPSKNIFIKNGAIETRKGYQLFGGDVEEENKENEVTKSDTWNTSLGNEITWKTSNNKFYVYIDELDSYVELLNLVKNNAISYTTWIDQNQDIVRDRFVFVDGSDTIYVWNGAIAKIESIDGNNVVIEGDKTLAQLGFDKGDTATQTVNINGEEKTYTQSDINTNTLTLNNTENISVGDYIISRPAIINNNRNLSGFNKDTIYSYKNHLVCSSFSSPKVFFSDSTVYDLADGFDFEIPALQEDRTLATPFFVILNNGVQGMAEKRGNLRISTLNAWFSINKSMTYDSLGFNVSVERSDIANDIGCMPNAIAEYKGDIIFVARDKTIQNIIDVDTKQESAITSLSEDIKDLLKNSDLTGVKIRYTDDNILITIPKEHLLLMFDISEGFWQPPQYFPISDTAYYKGKLLGQSTGGNNTFELFEGGSDLGADIDYNITFGFQNYNDSVNEFVYKTLNSFGMNIRIKNSHGFKIRYDFIAGGKLFFKNTEAEWDDILKADYNELFGLGSDPLGSAIGDSEKTNSDIKKAIWIDTLERPSFFEWRPIITLSGQDIYMRIISYTADIDIIDALKIDKKIYQKKQNFSFDKRVV